MEYRINKTDLLNVLQNWNRFLRRKVHLIACGGTAMTLLAVKPSTKDIDFMVPVESEHDYLIKQLEALDYKQVTASGWQRAGEIFRFDMFRGNLIHTTELLVSPLEEGRNKRLQEFTHLYLGILNDYDLISSKLMRGFPVDFDDCLDLIEARREEIDISRLRRHFEELVSYDVAQDRLRPNIDHLFDRLKEKGLYD